jgi:hypothetical protein
MSGCACLHRYSASVAERLHGRTGTLRPSGGGENEERVGSINRRCPDRDAFPTSAKQLQRLTRFMSSRLQHLTAMHVTRAALISTGHRTHTHDFRTTLQFRTFDETSPAMKPRRQRPLCHRILGEQRKLASVALRSWLVPTAEESAASLPSRATVAHSPRELSTPHLKVPRRRRRDWGAAARRMAREAKERSFIRRRCN